MSVIAKISRDAAERKMPFLLIGGYAVMAHGFVRTTGDVDLLVKKSQAAGWKSFLEDRKFILKFSGPTFLQFDPPADEKLPLDLMFVAEKDFDQMWLAAKEIEMDGIVAKAVSLPHLFALKCHAFKGRAHRAMKDIEDLGQLTRLNKLDSIRCCGLLCLSTVALNFMNSSNVNATHFILNDAADLEFPDWSGMKPHNICMSPAEAFRWNEEMLALFSPPGWFRRDSNRCMVEFKL